MTVVGLFSAAVILLLVWGCGIFLVKILFDLPYLLGKGNLAILHTPAQDLLDLEKKLESPDIEKSKLANYRPVIYSPGHLGIAEYQPELPGLFKRQTAAVSFDIDIDDVRILLFAGKVPAYQRLKAISKKPAPEFPFPPPSTPKPIVPPENWTKWDCKEHDYEVPVPRYSGIFRPFNYFIDKNFREVIGQANSLRLRQTEAIEKAKRRNHEVESLAARTQQIYETAKQEQERIWRDVQERSKKRVESFFRSYALN